MVSIGIMVQYWTSISQYCHHDLGIVTEIPDWELRIVRLTLYCQIYLEWSGALSIVRDT
jgi:hypothetical protein